MKTVLCFGNSAFSETCFSMELARELSVPGCEFVTSTKADNLFDYLNHDSIYIMDHVHGLDKVTLIKELDQLTVEHGTNNQDLDLSFFLKLMQAAGKLNSVNLIGLPHGVPKPEIKAQLSVMLSKL